MRSFRTALFYPTGAVFFEQLNDSNNDWYQGWLELARLQQRGEVGTVRLFLSPQARRRVRYGIKAIPYELSAAEPDAGTYAFSAFEYFGHRNRNREHGRYLPLLEKYAPSRVIAGSVILVEVVP